MPDTSERNTEVRQRLLASFDDLLAEFDHVVQDRDRLADAGGHAAQIAAQQEEIEALKREVDRLRRQLASRRVVEAAKWRIVQEHKVSEPEAHKMLQRASARRNLTLEQLCERVMLRAEVAAEAGA